MSIRLTRFPPLRSGNLSNESLNAYHNAQCASGVLHKTILITGCAGFIGHNLTLHLLKDPTVKIIGIDNLIVSECPPINDDRFHFIKWNIVEDWELLEELPKIDEIYHLASIASPEKYKLYPLETLDVNVLGTRNMLKLAQKHGARFLLTSTSEIYGDPLVHPQPESYYGNVNTVGERSCYDESKRCAETYVYEYRRLYGLDAKICRIFNTYGPHMDIDDGRIITNIIKQIIRSKPVVIYGNGKQTRSFCYIDDMVDGLVALMASQETGPINLGNPATECSINDLVRTFEKILATKIITTHVERTENDPMVRRPDIRVAQRLLGFRPKIGLEKGLQKTFDYFASQQSA